MAAHEAAAMEPHKKELNSKLLDLAFAMDCTGSMGSYIQSAQQNIKSIVEDLVSKEHADIHLGLVEYRDHPPQDNTFVTRVLDFTSSVREMKKRLDECSASGGGDEAEAVTDALHALLKLNWREDAVKICVFIADAPPHALGSSGDGFPNGCPCGLDPMVVCNQLATKGATMYVVGCEPSILSYKEWFSAVAYMTGGRYVPLQSAKLLAQVIIGGAQEEMSLQHLMAEVNQEVEERLSALPDGAIAQQDVEKMVQDKLMAKGVKSKHLLTDVGALPEITTEAKKLSELNSMAEIRSNFKIESRSSYSMPGLSRAACAYGGVRGADAYGSVSGAAPVSGYSVTEDDVSYDQCSRMTEKAMRMSNLKSKCYRKD